MDVHPHLSRGAVRRHAQRPAAPLGPRSVTTLTSVFSHLGDETRLLLLWTLSQRGDLQVPDLCQLVGQPPPVVRHHLRLLRQGGLISARRHGKRVWYAFECGYFCGLLENLARELGCADHAFRLPDFSLRYRRAGR